MCRMRRSSQGDIEIRYRYIFAPSNDMIMSVPAWWLQRMTRVLEMA